MGPDTSQKPDRIEWQGVTYRLMGYGRPGYERQYYLSQSKDYKQRKGARGLHVAVWEFHSGRAVPAGHVVHHKDHDPFNNAFENLECVSNSEHHREHPHRDPQKQREHLARIREQAIAWHKSTEGREWHRQNAATYVRKPRTCHCVCCGRSFTALRSAKFCSEACGLRYRYRLKRGLQPYD